MSVELNTSSESTLLGDVASNCLNFTMDLTGQVQGGFEMTSALQQKFGYLSLKIFGASSCLNLVSGPISAARGYTEFRLGERLKDWLGQLMGWLKCVQGGLQTFAGALFIPATGLAIALDFTVSKIVKIASKVFGHAGSIALSIGSLLMTVVSTLSLVEQIGMRRRIYEILDQTAIPLDQRQSRVIEMLREIGATAKGESQLARLFDQKVIKQIQTASKEETHRVVLECLRNQNRNIALLVFYISLGVIGALLTVLSLVFTAGASAFVIAILGSGLSLIWLILDVYFIKESFASNERGKMDKPWLLFSALFYLVLTGLGLFFCSSMWATITTVIMGLILLLTHLVCYVRMNRGPAQQPC